MSNNHFVFQGIDELLALLRTLPAELGAESAGYVLGAADAAEAEVRAVYEAHRHTGTLARRLVRDTTASTFGTSVRLRNTAPHAWIFENGTQARHYTTASGKPHATGAMWGKTAQPPTHVFVRTMQKHRKRMYEQLSEMVRQHGLTVTGEP